jgi:hypothetical protein
MSNKASKFYSAVFSSIETKNPKNIDAKSELNSTGFAKLDACADVTAHEIGHPNKKTKVE